jgi:hypothetical protein
VEEKILIKENKTDNALLNIEIFQNANNIERMSITLKIPTLLIILKSLHDIFF